MLSPSRWMEVQLRSGQTCFGNNKSCYGGTRHLPASQANLMQPARCEGVRPAVVEAYMRHVSAFVKLSCEDVAHQLLLVYAGISARTSGVVIQLVWDRWHKRTHACINTAASYAPSSQTCSYGEIKHQQYNIASPSHNKDRGSQILIFTGTQANTHKNYVTVQEKAQGYLSIPETKLGLNYSPSLSLCFCLPFLCPSLAGEVAFWLGGQRAGSDCQAGKRHKAAALTTTELLFPFQTNSHSTTSLPRSRIGAERESNWPPIRLIRPYWIWLIENTRIRHSRQSHPFMMPWSRATS